MKRALIDDAKRRAEPIKLAAIGQVVERVLAAREIRGFLYSLRAHGARVMYRAVDVRDPRATAAACAAARAEFGPITAIIHGAGVLADKRIEDKTREQVDRVMDTKVLGLRSLLDATAGDPLDTVAIFSSVAGRFGNVGQVDYAMANEALNEMAVAFAASRPNVVVKSLNWGPWEGGMVTPALKAMFEERGVRVLTHTDGARHFVDELRAGDRHVEVVFGAALATGDRPRTSHALVDEHTWPMLADHAINGVPVLPVVAALELMARAARELTGRCPASFVDLRVLRGVRLPRLFDGGHIVEVELAAVRDGALRARLRVAEEPHPAYEATLETSATTFVPLERPPLGSAALGDVYRTALFHGPKFAVIDAVDGISDAGLSARVCGMADRGWPADHLLDGAALDAALQAALLWARHATGGAFLPTGIARVDVVAAARGLVDCIVLARHRGEHDATVDVDLVEAGALVAALRGVRLHRLTRDDAFTRQSAGAPPAP